MAVMFLHNFARGSSKDNVKPNHFQTDQVLMKFNLLYHANKVHMMDRKKGGYSINNVHYFFFCFLLFFPISVLVILSLK